MLRAVIDARYSSDHQREASIEDQLEVCRRYVERQGWTMGEVYADQALSGASRFRPAFQQMQADAEQRRFDVVVVEVLDRLSTASARLKWGSDQTYGRVSTAVGRRADLPRASVDRQVVTRSGHQRRSPPHPRKATNSRRGHYLMVSWAVTATPSASSPWLRDLGLERCEQELQDNEVTRARCPSDSSSLNLRDGEKRP
jgi:Resolvase, N terminal domain